MEALNAVGLTPISVLSDRRTEPRKLFSLFTSSSLKSPISAYHSNNPPNLSEGLSKSSQKGLVLLSSLLSTGFARALTYEEALQEAQSTSASFGGSLDFNPSVVLDSVISFGVENPAVIIGGATILAVPLVLSQLLKKPKAWGVESAKTAYAKLADEANAQLLDIRAPGELGKMGSPDIRGLKKKPVSVVYKGQDKPGFLKKLGFKFKEPESTTLFILDKFAGNSELVAELVTANGFKSAYAIKDGAEGPRGWMNSGLPWILPKKTLSLDFSNLTDAINGAFGDGSDALPVTLGLAAAAAALGLLAFSEVETLLELLGSAALVQLISKKLLFAEDRKETLKQVDEFLNTKVAPQELVDDVKQIGKALLPSVVSSKTLPAPVEASPAVKVEAAAEPPPQINSVPKTEPEAESLPGLPRPLSPYPFYPEFRPPTSPTPSQP